MRPLRASLVVPALAAALVALALVVLVLGHLPGEQRLLRTVASVETLQPVARVVDRWTGYVPVAVAAALLVVALACTRRRRAAAVTAVCVGGAIVGNALLKRLVGRDRPELLPVGADASSLSFPSGHAAATAALALVVVLLLAGTRWRTPAAVAATTAVVLAGAAQLVLARHHPTDVLGGWLWAGSWVIAVWSLSAPVTRRARSRRQSPPH